MLDERWSVTTLWIYGRFMVPPPFLNLAYWFLSLLVLQKHYHIIQVYSNMKTVFYYSLTLCVWIRVEYTLCLPFVLVIISCWMEFFSKHYNKWINIYQGLTNMLSRWWLMTSYVNKSAPAWTFATRFVYTGQWKKKNSNIFKNMAVYHIFVANFIVQGWSKPFLIKGI